MDFKPNKKLFIRFLNIKATLKFKTQLFCGAIQHDIFYQISDQTIHFNASSNLNICLLVLQELHKRLFVA